MPAPIGPELFAFLRELRENNDKAWFEANRERYRRCVQRPMIGFIEAVSPWLMANAPAFVADTRLQGGSLFRIHRDTRFTADKSPYKTNVGCNFRHRVGKDAHAPGFYVHIAPDEVFFGGGIWSPPTPALNAIRDAIVDRPERWGAIVGDPSFARLTGGLADSERLKTAPRGYPKDHPHMADLRRKSLFAFSTCPEEAVCDPDFPGRVTDTFAALVPMMDFMSDALGVGRD